MNDDLAALPDDIKTLKAALVVARAEAAAALAQCSHHQALIAHLKLEITKLQRNRFGPYPKRTARPCHGDRAAPWRRYHRAGAGLRQDRHGRAWVYVRDDRPFGGPAPPAAVFYYSRDRHGEHLQGKQPAVISPLCLELAQRIDALFAIERDIHGCPACQRHDMRQELRAPLVGDRHAWLRAQRGRLSRTNWEWGGTLERIHQALYVKCREHVGREASPTAAIIDSQSVKSAEKRAFD